MTARTVFPYVHTWLCLICRSIVSADTPSCLLWHAVNDTWRFPRQHTSLFPAQLRFFKLQVSAGRHTMRAASPTSSAAQPATMWQSLQEATSSSHGPPGRPTGSHTTAPRGYPRHLVCAIFWLAVHAQQWGCWKALHDALLRALTGVAGYGACLLAH